MSPTMVLVGTVAGGPSPFEAPERRGVRMLFDTCTTARDELGVVHERRDRHEIDLPPELEPRWAKLREGDRLLVRARLVLEMQHHPNRHWEAYGIAASLEPVKNYAKDLNRAYVLGRLALRLGGSRLQAHLPMEFLLTTNVPEEFGLAPAASPGWILRSMAFDSLARQLEALDLVTLVALRGQLVYAKGFRPSELGCEPLLLVDAWG